jgi:hypothetical protein
MRAPGRFVLLLAWIALGAALVPGAARADRDFAGTITALSQGSVGVESRMGDERSFVRSPRTKVTGHKAEWGQLRRGDRVVVSWSFSDEDPEARRIHVVGGED